jgi:FG-GAP-like repeat
VDVNGDSKKDLIATPNALGGENFKSVWLYKNTSLTNTVNFQFVQDNFLQDEMIDVGQNSFPIVFDYNADGKTDLLIGNYGYYGNGVLNARLTLYQNIGSAAVPSYSLITRDYAGLSTRTLSNSLPLNNAMPTAGDIDNDGDVDICIGTSSGQIHWLENTAGAGNVCNFSVFKENPFSFTTGSSAAAPQLFDLDADGKLDLLIGTKNGRISCRPIH